MASENVWLIRRVTGESFYLGAYSTQDKAIVNMIVSKTWFTAGTVCECIPCPKVDVEDYLLAHIDRPIPIHSVGRITLKKIIK
jgi:hypothetical protein